MKMRIIANENISGDAVKALQQEGHEVIWIRTKAPGTKDHDILEMAQRDKLVVITFDKDFGELAFSYGLPAQCGVILFRVPPLSPEFLVRFIVQSINNRDDWSGIFAVIEPDRIRIRPLPKV
jgi:predicted nuclease of predicted toxin-antitoxin system